MSELHTTSPVTILLSALGGEGGGVLADWLVDTARHNGHAVQGTSIPGVAQRTGATTYYVEIFPLPDSALGGRKPVFGLYAVPGGLDLLVGSELMEATRQCALGLVSPDRTAVVVSTSRSYTTIERMQQADGRVPADRLVEVLRSNARELELLDMATLAQQSNTVVSAVMFGALAGWCFACGLLPFDRAAYEATIRAGGKGVEPSLRGFAAAWHRVVDAKSQRDHLMAVAREVSADLAAKAKAKLPVLPPALAARLPVALHDIVALGVDRLLDYQDAAYAELYVQRLERLLAAGRAGGMAVEGNNNSNGNSSGSGNAGAGAGADAVAAVAEAARWLALWMAFDDIVRVAELKGRPSRFERVRREVKAVPGELLRIHDHFKPGVPEFAAMLPARWAQVLQRWDARRGARGELPFALPLALPSHSVRGLLALRLLGGFKRLRRWGSRYGVEQALIERWLAALARGLAQDAGLGLQIARAGRLIKGYGSTNERGKHQLLHIVDQLASAAAVGDAPARGRAVGAALAAALADDAGKQLDATLVAHGAAPRPLVAQPVRWFARPPAREVRR
jgi:indolepyruvate ferredoxin oxidoreductase beta subunit